MTTEMKTTQTNSISGRGIKNPSLYSRTVEEEYLRQLSKACLLDLLIETLRLNMGHCDTPLTVAELNFLCANVVGSRKDKMPTDPHILRAKTADMIAAREAARGSTLTQAAEPKKDTQ